MNFMKPSAACTIFCNLVDLIHSVSFHCHCFQVDIVQVLCYGKVFLYILLNSSCFFHFCLVLLRM